MANANNPYGLSPVVRNLHGGPCQANGYKKLAGWGTPIYPHDVVKPLSDGDIHAGGTPGTDLFLGVSLNYGAGSTATDHLVIDDYTALFECQDDGTGSGLLEADMRLNANFVFTAGNATLPQSKHQIASSTKATTASLDAKILRRISDFGPGSEWGQYCRVEVMFNQHVYKPIGAGV